ncbi:MAG TPA: hypothetical protein VF624_06055 [Tepidisphaeraceae bacterium]
MSSRLPSQKSAPGVAIDAFEQLEDRRMMAASPAVVAGIKVAKRADADATALNSNRITVAFQNKDGTPAALRLVDATKIRTFGYANDLINPALQRKVAVGLTVENSGNGVLTITTDRLIRKGSRLQILTGALTDSKGRDIIREGSNSLVFTVGQNKPRYTLSNRNFVPTDLSYFSKDVFANAPTPTTASTAPSAASIRTSLAAFMNAKVTRGTITQAQANNAVALFDNPAFSYVTPNLRAGLASLYGTAAEPAIDSFLGKSNLTKKPYSIIEFSSAISSSAVVGETKISESGRLTLRIRPGYAGEDFRALSAILAHESLHQDTVAASGTQGTPPNSQDEEIIANTVQATVYIQQAMVDPSFVGNGTVLVNSINDQVLALLNSGDALFPYGGIRQAPARTNNGNVFVGAKTNPGNYNNNTAVKSFEDWIRREYVFRGFNAGGTTANPVAVSILKNIVGTAGNFATLGTQVQDYLDTRNAVLTDATYIRMAQALKLTF